MKAPPYTGYKCLHSARPTEWRITSVLKSACCRGSRKAHLRLARKEEALFLVQDRKFDFRLRPGVINRREDNTSCPSILCIRRPRCPKKALGSCRIFAMRSTSSIFGVRNCGDEHGRSDSSGLILGAHDWLCDDAAHLKAVDEVLSCSVTLTVDNTLIIEVFRPFNGLRIERLKAFQNRGIVTETVTNCKQPGSGWAPEAAARSSSIKWWTKVQCCDLPVTS